MSQRPLCVDAEYIELPPLREVDASRASSEHAARKAPARISRRGVIWIGVALVIAAIFATSFYAGYAHYANTYYTAQQHKLNEDHYAS